MAGAPLLLLKRTKDGGRDATQREQRAQPMRPREPVWLVCVRCGHTVTSRAAARAVAGAHEHTFANPHGFVFRIGCFRRAPGCVTTSQPTREFSWFPAYAWQVAICSACAQHLGWLFRSDDDAFHALILDRLAESGKG